MRRIIFAGSVSAHSRTIAGILLGLAISACAPRAVIRDARLYPANEIARPDGVLTGQFVAHGTGHGAVEITMPDGEVLKGEFSIVRGGSVGFGSIYGEVYGPNGSASMSGESTTRTVPGGSQGMASTFGTKGTSVDCEFYNDNFSGHGMGARRSSKGALYRLQY